MSEPKWTKGSRTVEGRNLKIDGRARYVHVVTADHCTIAYYGNENDGRLSAAAPELYEALNVLVARAQGIRNGEDVDLCQALHQAGIVLAKARGEHE